MEPLVTTRTYNYSTKEITNQRSDVISFGTVPPSSSSDIIIINCVISGVLSAGDLGIGIANSNLPLDSFPGSIYYSVFDSLDEATEPNLPFYGVSGYGGLTHVVDVGFNAPLTSKYIALRIHASNAPLTCGCVVLKWFFGFDKKEV